MHHHAVANNKHSPPLWFKIIQKNFGFFFENKKERVKEENSNYM
jgi:hypothetical protein